MQKHTEMSLNWMIDSPSLYVTSSTASTPLGRPSQESFANTPVESVVPRTPSITNHHYRNDQCVPHTPATLTNTISPTITISIPGTPSNNLNTTSPSRFSILYFDNQDDTAANTTNSDSANTTSIDQTVPSTPTSNACEPYVHMNSGGHFSHSCSVNGNSDFCVGDPVPSRNIVTKHLRNTPRKNVNNCAHTLVSHQRLPSKKASATLGSTSNSNTTVTLNTAEYSSKPTKETCNATSGRAASTLLDHIPLSERTNVPAATLLDHIPLSERTNVPAATLLDNIPLSERINVPAATTPVCFSSMLPSDALATVTTSTIAVSPEVPGTHTRETSHVHRQFTQTEARNFQGCNETVQNNSTQLQLFDDDDDIF